MDSVKVTIEPGMVVRVKSGGEPMTVEAANVSVPWWMGRKRTVRCVWFDFNQKLRRDYFDPETLTTTIEKKK